MTDAYCMAIAAHSLSDIQVIPAARAATIEPWMLQSILMTIVAILSVASFAAGYQIG